MRATRIGPVERQAVTVRCTTLDAFLDAAGLGCPSFVKIDVEGSELSVLRGMAKLLDAPEITLMIEVTEQHRAVFEVLHGAGFRMFTPRMKRIEFAADLDGNVFCFKCGDRRLTSKVRR